MLWMGGAHLRAEDMTKTISSRTQLPLLAMEDQDEFGDLYADAGPSFTHKSSLEREQLLYIDERDVAEELEICTNTDANTNNTRLHEFVENESDGVRAGNPARISNANNANIDDGVVGEVGSANGEEECNTDDDSDSDDLNILVNQDEGDDDSMIVTNTGYNFHGIMGFQSPPSVRLGVMSASQDHHHHFSNRLQFKYLRPDEVATDSQCSDSTDIDESHSKFSVFNGASGRCGRGGSVVEISDWSTYRGRCNMQRNLHSGVGVLPWNGGNMSQKRSGFEFTLPFSKTIFDIDLDKFEEKHWRQPGVDVTDFFNFGLNEDSWKSYRRKLEQFQLEATMQKKICVCEIGRYEERHDPDLPPELLTVIGLHESSRESIRKKSDIGSVAVTNPGRSLALDQFVPTGRPIQVERGLGERLPSVDVRRPRLRDSDAVIQIVVHDKTEDDFIASTDALNIADDISQKEESGKVHNEIEGNRGWCNAGYLLQEMQSPYKLESEIPPVDKYSQRGTTQTPLHDEEGILPSPSGPPVPYQQISKSEPGMCPITILGLSQTARQSTTYKSYLYIKDEKSNQNVVNQRGATVSDNHYVKKHVIRKWHPVAGSKRVIEKNSKDEIHFDRISKTFDRQSSELKIQPDGRGDNGYVHSTKRQKLNIQNELPEVLAADHNYLLNMIRSDNSKSASANSMESSEDQGDAEQQGSGCSQQKWSCSSAERIELQSEEKSHLRTRKEYCWNGRCEADKDIIPLKGEDVSDYIRGKEDAYLDRYYEEICYDECKEERFENHREIVVHANYWQPTVEHLHIVKDKYEDVTRDKLDMMEKLKHRPKQQDTKRHFREEHLLGRKRKVTDARNDYWGREEAIKHRGTDGHIVGQQGKDKVLYRRKNKEEDMKRKKQADSDEGIRNEIDCNYICRNKHERNDYHLRRKEVEPWKRDGSEDTKKITQFNDVWKHTERENEYWRKVGHKVYYKRERDRRCWPSGRSKYKEYKLWHGCYRSDSHFQEETSLLSIHKFKLYNKRWHQKYGKIRALIDEDGRTRYHESDGICPWEDHYTYERRSSRHKETNICYNRSDSCQHEEECKFFREKYKLDTTRKEFHGSDRHESTSGQADDILRNDLTIDGERRKPEDLSTVRRGEKVPMEGMEIPETERMRDGHHNHQTQNHEKMLDMLKKTQEQSGVCLDFVQLKKDVHNVCHHDNDHTKNRYSKFESWEHHKENMQDLDSSINKEVTRSKEEIVKMEEDGKKAQTNLKKIEVKSVKDKQNLTEGHVAVDEMRAVRNGIINASDGKMVNIDKVHQRYLDMLAKMEKRIERFKQPIITEKHIYKNAQYETSIQKEVAEVKQERPARKRRWSSG